MKSSVLCTALLVAIAACAPTKQAREDNAAMNKNMDMAMSDMDNENMVPSMDRMENMNDMNNMDEAMNLKREKQMTEAMDRAMDEMNMADGMNMDMDHNMAMKRHVEDMNEMNMEMDKSET